MSTDLLRQYPNFDARGDGYPAAWHLPTIVTRHGTVLYGTVAGMILPENVVEERPAIKDLIRELAGHRCQRCGHPYAKGEHKLNELGQSWSPCDDGCTHMGEVRIRDAGLGEEDSWRELRLESSGVVAGDARMDYGPNGTLVVRFDVEALWRVLTVHHLDEDKLNCRWWNLAALCQRCHLRMQRAVVMGRPYHYEHSEWFKPHAAGFYAWKYLGEDLSREEVYERKGELLSLEHRFTQEALL